MKRYLGRKLVVYLLTFFVAVTIDWVIPRFMPGNPVEIMLSRLSLRTKEIEVMRGYYLKAFGLDIPLWQQYLNFWKAVFHGDLGVSVYLFPKPVSEVIMEAAPYSFALLFPAVILSWFAGNRFGAFAARRKVFDNILLPVSYFLRATPIMWFGILLAWAFGVVLGWFPIAGAYSFDMTPQFSWGFVGDLLRHWFLPFVSLFLVLFGGWAIGMRNMIIYELEADYCQYLEALGAPRKLIRKYAYRNALLPQITGLPIQLGQMVVGGVVTEVVFSYPGVGYLILQAIQNQDYFLIQGCFLFIIIVVLLGNLVVDILYIIMDPRTRRGMVSRA